MKQIPIKSEWIKAKEHPGNVYWIEIELKHQQHVRVLLGLYGYPKGATTYTIDEDTNKQQIDYDELLGGCYAYTTQGPRLWLSTKVIRVLK